MAFPSIDLGLQPDNPAYQEIARQIRAAIEGGALRMGDRLPPIRRLAEQLGLNRDTVALAYESLASDGLLESTVGRGTFVAGPDALPVPTVKVRLAASVERVLEIEDARPRFGATDGVVQLHSLVPDPATYPVDEFRRVLNRVLSDGEPDLFSYGVPRGHPGLRQVLADRFSASGMGVDADDIVLCHGASQGISLALRLFCESGDVVAVETPTYHNVLAALAALGLEPAAVPMHCTGPDLDVLERELARPEVKAFYTIPTFHNPMGVSTNAAHRRQLLQIAAKHGVPVIEDAFETDLRFAGKAVPPLAALDRSGLVVHLFSFSKSLFPGARVGSIVARGRALEGLMALKHSSDLSDSMPLQAALAEFIRSGAYDRHLGRMRRTLRARRKALLEALDAHMPDGTTYTRPDGGYQVWVELPPPIDTAELLADAARAGVLFAPGAQFMPGTRSASSLRLTLARADEDEIRKGVEILGRVAKQRLARGSFRAAGPAEHL